MQEGNKMYCIQVYTQKVHKQEWNPLMDVQSIMAEFEVEVLLTSL